MLQFCNARWRRLLVVADTADLGLQGVIAAEEVDSFNEPFYSPCLEEVRGAVEQEGSFEILGLESHGILERGSPGRRREEQGHGEVHARA